jgi:lipoprotein-releasing system permease protein
MMFMLLVLIVAIAAFNIVSAQTMPVNEAHRHRHSANDGRIGGLVLRVVLVQGYCCTGHRIGLLLGLLLANHVTETVSLLESLIGARLLDGSYFDTVPSVVLPSDIALIAAVSLRSAWCRRCIRPVVPRS